MRRERNGAAVGNVSRRTMILLYISIPIMVLAVAIATLPLLHAMRIESRLEHARARAAGVDRAAAGRAGTSTLAAPRTDTQLAA